MSLSTLLRVSLASLTLLYPIVVFVGLQSVDARYLILLLIIIGGIRILSLGKSPLNHWTWLPLLVVLALWTWVSNTSISLKLYPVFINLGFLILFSTSLRYPPSIIEQLARFQDPQLPERAIVYTRTVTRVWCYFFAINGVIAFLITCFGSDAIWAIYNGLISYLLMGVIFLGEWLIRQRVIKSHDD
ncbi:hypothetical protein AB835_07925 [Candidatus Endobugula sertula]|uniref:DNA gyrase subunit B n=1 Tax=Candidatus Endobugula sertula TaxID=62101 RepID=A0A1D2QPX4_9GAMM|nr:hypothetical protein AB835_07925 [Candidatus Endobugula sertula]